MTQDQGYSPPLGLWAELTIDDWERVIHYVDKEDYGSLRAVCRSLKKIVDDIVKKITIPYSFVDSRLPDVTDFPSCEVFEFNDAEEDTPDTVREHCTEKLARTRTTVCGKAWWKSRSLQTWLSKGRKAGAAWVSLFLQICEHQQDRDLSDFIEGVLDDTDSTMMTLMALWCEVRGLVRKFVTACCSFSSSPLQEEEMLVLTQGFINRPLNLPHSTPNASDMLAERGRRCAPNRRALGEASLGTSAPQNAVYRVYSNRRTRHGGTTAQISCNDPLPIYLRYSQGGSKQDFMSSCFPIL
jgi:hypothetical protein